MKLHVISLPHTQLDKSYSVCAYTEKCRKFAKMMTARGHEVFTYTNTKANQKKHGFNGPKDYLKIDFDSSLPIWTEFNALVIKKMRKQIKPDDIICVITGDPTKAIAEAFPNNLVVEFGVGYSGITHPYRVFESYAWRNFVYGKYDMNGAFFDEVIPNYFEVEDFPLVGGKQDYYLFIGRINANKGLPVAQDVCERLGKRLVVAGPGDFSGYGEYVGVVGPKERAKLMSQAIATFVPTMYVPPFEGVHIESMLCGTPVITTDFGVFSETVINGFNGYRCKMFNDFMEAAEKVKKLSPLKISVWAASRYSTEVVAKQYEKYFERLLTLNHKGWYN